MREGCKHYESRTYASGETVRQCRLDLAPEAPWRCPAECPGFEPRRVDAGWSHGSLVAPAPPPEPPRIDADVTALLDQAEDIVNRVGHKIVAEVQEEREKVRRHEQQRSSGVAGWFRRLRKRQ